MPDPSWRVVLCPKGSAGVVSDRDPGQRVGQPGSLSGWSDGPRLVGVGLVWLTWDDATQQAHAHNQARAGQPIPRVTVDPERDP